MTMDKKQRDEIVQTIAARAPELLDRVNKRNDPVECILDAWQEQRAFHNRETDLLKRDMDDYLNLAAVGQQQALTQRMVLKLAKDLVEYQREAACLEKKIRRRRDRSSR